MSLPVPNLDDRGFQDFVDDAKRLIPQYLPEWTNHNVSDPGVALLELFAWMSELVIYRLNQTPDKLYTQFLNLLGVRPFSAQPANVDLTFWLSAPTDRPVVVPKGTVVSGSDPADLGRQIVEFATTTDLLIEQPTLIASLTGFGETELVDVFDDLRFDRERVKVFRSVKPGDCFYLGFAGSIAGDVLRLDITAETRGTGIRPEEPPIRWETWSGRSWDPCHVALDTTGGLNRNGSIRIYVPGRESGHEDHVERELLTLADKRAYWLRARLTKPLRKDAPTYEESPEVWRLHVTTDGGTVLAEHSITVENETVGRSKAVPAQEFRLRNASVLPRNPATEFVRVQSIEAGQVMVTDWREVDDFSMSGPEDHDFVWDESQGMIVFGPSVRYPDGTMVQHGAIPPLDGVIEVTAYRHGGGLLGNLPAGTIVNLYTAIPYIARVGNREPSLGGVDAEAPDNVKERGPMTLRTGQRAVTTGDFERLAENSSKQVARSRCLRPKAPGDPVKVLVVPTVDRPAEELEIDDFMLRDSLYHRVAEHLDERRVLGTVIEVTTPFYVGVSVAALVRATPGRPARPLSALIVKTISEYLSPLTGGPDRRGWPWDRALTTALLQAVVAEVPGVVSVDELVLFAVDLRNGARIGPGVQTLHLDERSLFLGFKHQAVVK